MKTPVLFCIYNRPEVTARVFSQLAQIRPERLLVIADGPRPEVSGDAEKVAATRAVIDRIDWPCELTTDYSSLNLGCRIRMASGISWAFEQEDELIILEDDCLPDESFFGFCEQLLQRYRSDARITSICGTNFQPARNTIHSYYFSRWAHVWGWATWKRAWDTYDVDINSWPGWRSKRQLKSVVDSLEEYRLWHHVFDNQYAGHNDTWDFPWLYNCWMQDGLTIIPSVNLVSNIGFGSDATHTTDPEAPLANRPVKSIGRLSHPGVIERDQAADKWTYENMFAQMMPAVPQRANRLKRLGKKIRSVFRRAG
ncbi:MAG: glycosyltransferase family 2 protein [Planctomycetota bacterium]